MAKKILKCEYTKHWNHFPIIQLQIEKIWQSVPAVDFLPLINKPFKKNLINDIKNNGMHFPIMVVKSNHKELLEAKEKFGEKISMLPFWHNDHTIDQTAKGHCLQLSVPLIPHPKDGYTGLPFPKMLCRGYL